MARFDFNKKEDVEKASKRIRIAYQKYANGIGNPDDAVQEILCRLLEGKHQHSTFDQIVIDYLRANFSNSRVLSNNERQNLNNAHSLEPGDLDRLLPMDFAGERNKRLDFDECLRWIGNQIDRGCFLLHYKWGLSEAEIGNIFKFGESRVSQRLQRIQKCIHARIKSQESRAPSCEVAPVLRPQAERQLWGMGQITFERMETGQSFGVESFNEKSF